MVLEPSFTKKVEDLGEGLSGLAVERLYHGRERGCLPTVDAWSKAEGRCPKGALSSKEESLSCRGRSRET